MTVALGLAAVALLVWPARDRAAARLGLLSRRPGDVVRRPGDVVRRPGGVGLAALTQGSWLHVVAGLAAVAGVLVVGGLPGVVLGALAAGAVEVGVPRLEPAARRATRVRRERDLPLLLDLMAVSLRAGQGLSGSLAAAAGAVGGPLADDVTRVAALLHLGATAEMAWSEFAADPVLAPVARAMTRAGESGSALAEAFGRLAADRRSARTLQADAAARRASVTAMLPLGLCFLPAFVAVGVVPVVLGVLSNSLGR